jgi:excinuclease ABC subunit C
VALAERVRQKLDSLPVSPGVYVFQGKAGEVLYIGKARSLRNRVRSYFTEGGSDDRYFIALLEHQLEDIETYVVETEKEAALLENHLIKQHKPRYNFKLRDDKDFLSLRLDPEVSWPRLEVVRRPKPDGARYFGPYHSATAARQTLRIVNRFFQLRTCTDTELESRIRPCLQYQIRRCPGPCVLEVDRAEYSDQVRLVGLFLDGRHDELVHDLEERMQSAASVYEYERAAIYRDQLRAVSRAREDQRVSTVKDVDQDVIGLHREADHGEIALLRIRNGRLVGVRTFDLKALRIPDDEIVAAFVREYYEDGTFVPDELVLPHEIELMEGLAELLSDARKKKMVILVPKRGARLKLVEMANDNAAHAFKEKSRAREDIEQRLDDVQRRLRLPRLPRRIECVDVSHTGGQDTVAAIVALADGAPDRKRYRSFNVEGVEPGDDYGAMYQVLARRFRRGREKQRGWELPDLFVVDGGKGQLNVALTAARDLELRDLPIVALAKEKETAYGDKVVDRVYLPGQKNPIALRESSAALQMLALARDEAHRASNLHRTRKGRSRKLRSELDDIPGIGPRTRRRLLTELGSIRGVALADEEALVRAGASRRQAHAIHRVFHAPAAPTTPVEADQAENAAVENAFAEISDA